MFILFSAKLAQLVSVEKSIIDVREAVTILNYINYLPSFAFNDERFKLGLINANMA